MHFTSPLTKPCTACNEYMFLKIFWFEQYIRKVNNKYRCDYQLKKTDKYNNYMFIGKIQEAKNYNFKSDYKMQNNF